MSDKELRDFELKVEFVKNLLNTLADKWNTYQYVQRSLETWANDTAVGSEKMHYLKIYSDTLYNRIQATRKLMDNCETFIINTKNNR